MYWKTLYQKKEKRLFILILILIYGIGILQYPIANNIKNIYNKIKLKDKVLANLEKEIQEKDKIIAVSAIGGGGTEIDMSNIDYEKHIKFKIKNYNLLLYKWRFEEIGYPVEYPGESFITCAYGEFGSRILNREGNFHYGIDMYSPYSFKVIAVKDGTVDIVNTNDTHGHHVRIAHLGRIKDSKVSHLTESYVKVGQFVKKGELIGMKGGTGSKKWCKGIHLHFEIRDEKGAVNPLMDSRYKKTVEIRKKT
jgi:murein DD-endopeptidase MepM/ murein hydrolase activator NlpD